MGYIIAFIAGAWIGMAIMSMIIVARDSDES